MAHNAANNNAAVDDGVDDLAVLNMAIHVFAHNAADIIVAGDDRVGKGNILHVVIERTFIIVMNYSEKSLTAADAADGVAVAVEGTYENVLIVDTYGGVVLAIGVEHIGVVGDVGTQLEKLSNITISAVYILC